MGKSKGKLIASIVMAAFGYYNPQTFGLAAGTAQAAWSAAMYGASLGATLWSVTHTPKDSANDYNRFDKMMNTTDAEAMIPIIYGTRKWGSGIQSYHWASNSNKKLTKDVILCEGEIEGIYGCTANDLIIVNSNDIPQVSETVISTAGTGNALLKRFTNAVNNSGQYCHVFTIMNIDYTDATVRISDNVLRLYANGVATNITLSDSNDSSDALKDYNRTIMYLIKYIASLGNGWRVLATTTASNSCNKLQSISEANCYNNLVSMRVASVKDNSYVFNNCREPDNWADVGGYKNCTWVRANLTINDEMQGGNPNIAAIIKGRKVKVYRDGQWRTEFSDNPAWIVRDFLCSKRYGMAKILHDIEYYIDDDSFKEVADYCDELVSYKDEVGNLQHEKRYTLNIILDHKNRPIEHLANIFANFGGFLVFTNNKIALRVEKPTSVSYSFDDSKIVEKSMQFSMMSLDDTPNQYRIGYFSPENNWTQVKIIVEDTVDQQERKKIIPKDITLIGSTSQTQAQRLGVLYKRLNKWCPLIIQFQTGTFAMHLEPGDVINVSYRNLFTDMPFRILEISEQNGIWNIKARQYNESIYNQNYLPEITVKNYINISSAFNSTPPEVTGLELSEYGWMNKDGTHIINIDVIWNNINYQYMDSYAIHISEDNITWRMVGYTTTNSHRISNLEANKKYYIKVQVLNTAGLSSNGIISDLTTIGKDNLPNDVLNFSVVQAGKFLGFTWSKINEPDIKLYEIRMGSSWVNSTLITQINDIKYTWEAPENGTLNFWIKAIDNFGNCSRNATLSSVNVFGLTEKNIIVAEKFETSLLSLENMYVDSLGKIQVQTKEKIHDLATFGDLFNTATVYADNPSIVLPVIDLGPNIVEDGYYYMDAWGNTKVQTRETLVSLTHFGDLFNTSTTYVEPKYIAETFLNINIDYNKTVNTYINTYYQTSIDNNEFSTLVSSLQKQFFGRYVKLTMYPQISDSSTKLSLGSINVSIDVPDVEDVIENVAIPAQRKYIKLPRKLFATPKSVALFVSDNNGQMAIWRMTNLSKDGFDLELLDNQGNLIAGKLLLARIRGY